MPDSNIDPRDTARLTMLRRLVTALMVVMIAGFLVLIGLLVTRFPTAPRSALPDLPAHLALPEGATPEAVTFGPGWIALVAGGRVLVYDRTTGALVQSVEIALPKPD